MRTARGRGIAVSYAPGARLVETSPAAIADAAAVARGSDAVIAFVGLDPRLEGEQRGTRFNPGGDRFDLDMPAAQRELCEALFATGKPVIVVLTGAVAAACQTADALDRHVAVAEDLATQPHAFQPARGEQVFFGLGHLVWLAGKKLHPAGCAAGVPAAGVKLVHPGILLQSQHQPFAFHNVKIAYSIHGQFGHVPPR